MFALHLKYHASNEDVWFETKEAATAALETLKPKLGDRFGRNEEPTHTIMAPSGPVVVVCAKIESARVVDVAEEERTTMPLVQRRHDHDVRFAAERAAAIKRAEKAVRG